MRLAVERWVPLSSRWLLLSTIVLSVLALGSIPPPALLVVTGLATAAALLALVGRGRDAVGLPGWALLALCGYTVLQALPLPRALVGALAPSTRDVWDAAYEVLREPHGAWLSLSLDPSATWLEAVKLWLYFCVFVSAVAVGARRGAGFGAVTIVASATLLGVVCLLHAVSDATRVFGLYTPSMGGSGFGVSPLINPNNRAGYLNAGVISAVAMLSMKAPPIPRWLLALTVPVMLGVSLLAGSRGGILGLSCGLIVLYVLLRSTRRQDVLPGKQVLIPALALTGTGAMFAVAAAGPRLQHLLLGQTSSKLTVMVAALDLLPTHWLIGIGRGSFESVFPALRMASDNTISSHPENFIVQWLTEWGVPVTLVAVGALVVALRPSRWGVARSVPACGVLAAVVSLLVQNLVDLGSEVPGVVVLAIAGGGFARGAKIGKAQRARNPLVAPGTVLLLGTLLIALGGSHARYTLSEDRAMLRAVAGDADWPSFRAALRGPILRHPAEPYFPRLAAYAAWRSGKESPLPWIGHALTRGMGAGRSHYLLGGYLASRGKTAQALLELRLAATYDPSLDTRVAKIALQLTQDEQELARAAPEGPAGARVLAAMAKRVSARPELATSLLRQSVVRDPESTPTRLALVNRLLEDYAAKRSECRENCLEEASSILASTKDNPGEVARLRARVLIERGSAPEAVALLNDECRRADRALPCIITWIEASRRARDRRSLHQAVLVLESQDCSSVKGCGAQYWSAGEAALALGDSEFALRCMERGASAQRSAARWREVARVARENGQPARASGALAHARALAPDDASLRKELDLLRHDTVEQLLRK